MSNDAKSNLGIALMAVGSILMVVCLVLGQYFLMIVGILMIGYATYLLIIGTPKPEMPLWEDDQNEEVNG